MAPITTGLGVFLAAIAASMFMPSGIEAQDQRVRCAGGHRITVVDLDISPDPIVRGQKIERLRAIVQVDGIGACDTFFEVREDPGVEVVAQSVNKTLRPGKNQVELKPIGSYRFRVREHCFQVVADISGARRTIDSARRFCAYETSRQSRRWSMRENDRANRR